MTISATSQGLRMGVATSTSRPAVPFDGQVISETDTDSLKVYNGSAWVTPPGGLVCVKAQTAFTAASTITVDNVFTSTYTNYLLHISSTCATASDVTLQLRASGTTATASDYNYQLLQVNSTTLSGVRTASSSSVGIYTTSQGSTLYDFSQTTIYQPQLAAATGFHAFSHYNNSASYTQPLRKDFFGSHALATSYDGFILTNSGSNAMTGTYTIYGYAKSV